MPVVNTVPGPTLTDLLFDKAAIGLCVVAPDGTVVRANAEWLRSTGFTEEQVVGQDILELVPATRDVALAMHARARAGHRVEVPRHAQVVNGRDTWWEGSIEPVPMEGGTGLLLTAREVIRSAEARSPGDVSGVSRVERDESGVFDPTWLVRSLGVIAAAIGGVHFVAWMTGAAARWAAEGVLTMKTNMSLAATAAGTALALSQWRATRLRLTVRSVASVLVLAVGLLTLIEHVFGVDLRIDQLLATEPPGAVGTTSPNRLGIPGAVSLVLLGAGLATLGWKRPLARYLGLATLLVTSVPAVGYLYRVAVFYSEARVTAIAWPTVIALSSVGLGLMLSKPQHGPQPLLWRDDPGGSLLRRLWGPAVLVLLVLGAVRAQGERLGLYDGSLGDAAFAIALILFFSAMLWRSAANLSASAARRDLAEEALRRNEEELRRVNGDLVLERRRLRETNEALLEAHRRKDEFLSAASHELRTPLATLRIHAESLSRSLSEGRADEARIRRKLGSMNGQLDRLQALISALLDVTRISAGRLQMERRSCDLAQITAEAVERFEDPAERAGVQVSLDAVPALGTWDAIRIDQVVTNLLDNALKHAPGSRIDVVVRTEHGNAILTVRDHGPGISPESQARIFQQYERAAEVRVFGGLGLGLWITRQIVEAHGGAISVESAPGAGSTFIVKLPSTEER